MSYYPNQIKEKRFKDINNRLKKLNGGNVRHFLLEQGYFPTSQYIPPDFFTSKELVKTGNLKKIQNLGFNNSKESSSSFLFFPKGKHGSLVIGIPSIYNYIYLCNFICHKWDCFKEHLLLKKEDLIIPYSYPLFYTNKKRTDVSIRNYKIFSEMDIPRLANHFDHCLFLDIKSFYPSIYTHALAWSLDEDTKDKKRRENKHWANRFDVLIRKMNRSRTKGILIGPETSNLASEILLRDVDSKISIFCKNEDIDIVGVRFKDDYVLFCDDRKSLIKCKNKIQMILNEYHLEINEQKTHFEFTEDIIDKKTWKVQINKLSLEIEKIYNNKDNKSIKIPAKEIVMWVKEINDLYDKYKDEYIIQMFLNKLIGGENTGNLSVDFSKRTNAPYEVNHEDEYYSLFAQLQFLCRKSPKSWPLFIVFLCMIYEGDNNARKAIEVIFNNLIGKFIDNENDAFLIWALYALWRCDIDVYEEVKDRIDEQHKDNWLINAFFDNSMSSFKIEGLEFSLVNNDKDTLTPWYELVSVFGYNS